MGLGPSQDTVDTEPTMRSQQIKQRIQSIGMVFGKDVQKKIMSRIPKETLQTISQAEDDQWLPVKLNVEIFDCIAAEVGEEGIYNLSAKSFNKILASSTVSQLFRSALHLFRIQPTTLVKLTGLFWRAIYRNCGDLSVVKGEQNQAVVLWSNIPPFIGKNRNYLMAIAGGIHSVIAYGGANPRVTLKEYSEEKREAAYVLSWVENS
jgi:hypothetical protein